MTRERFNQIFNEELARFVEEKSKRMVNEDLGDMMGALLSQLGELSSNVKKKNDGKNGDEEDEDDKENKKGRYKTKKLTGGRHEHYDYDEYKKKHKTTSVADTDELRNQVDMKRNNIKDIGEWLFPDHTPEGAQSQTRKILMGDRDMTDDVASKLQQGIDSGKIATK